MKDRKEIRQPFQNPLNDAGDRGSFSVVTEMCRSLISLCKSVGFRLLGA